MVLQGAAAHRQYRSRNAADPPSVFELPDGARELHSQDVRPVAVGILLLQGHARFILRPAVSYVVDVRKCDVDSQATSQTRHDGTTALLMQMVRS